MHVVLSSVTSGVLFLKDDLGPWAGTAGQLLSFALTSLNTAIQAMALADHAAAHTQGRVVFAQLQRDFATILTIEPPDQIALKFTTLSAKYSQAKNNCENIADLELHALRDASGDVLCPLITPTFLEKASGDGGAVGAALRRTARRARGALEGKGGGGDGGAGKKAQVAPQQPVPPRK